MADPWLSIIGINEDSADNLPPASRAALDAADVVFGGPRHLDLAGVGARGRAWPVPFSVDPVLACRGRAVAVLASGDPFWFGAGGSLVAHLERWEYRSYPLPSTFALAASHLGWRLEDVTCHGLHAAPFAQLRGVLAPQARLICLVRNGDAPAKLAEWLCTQGAGAARMWVMERMGSDAQRVRHTQADDFDLDGISAPVAVALELPKGVGISCAGGLPDEFFASDGQITKQPVRALTLSALAPRGNELLWDLGAGSGSISVEWCLAGGRAIAFERHAARSMNIRDNAETFGIAHRMRVLEGDSGALITSQPLPDAVFVGGGGTKALFDALFALLSSGTRVVANGVTLETESLLTDLHGTKGGRLLRVDLAEAAPLGGMRGWQPSRPIVQWSVTL